MAYTERYQIYRLHKAGFNIREIAKLAERHPSTIHREIRRNSDQQGRYDGKQAHHASLARRHVASSRARIDPAAWECVQAHLRDSWSPEQIARALEIQISVKRIHQYIAADRQAGGDLWKQLRRGSVNASVAGAFRSVPKGWTNVGVRRLGG